MKTTTTKFVLFTAFLIWGQVQAALNGNYTINSSLPASATNYQSFTSAVSDMVSGTRADGGPINGPAVSGPVVFSVAAQTFTERVSIGAVAGASSTNTITFQGVSPATSLLTFNSSTVQDYTLQLNGADHIRILDLGISNTGTTYGYGIQLLNNADNNLISGCIFNQSPTTTSLYHAGVIAGTYYTTTGSNANNLTITNNTFNGGTFAIVANGQSSAYSQNLLISGNTVAGSYNSGFYLQYQNLAVISGNTITPRTGYTNSYGAQFRYCNQTDVLRNKVTQPGLYGFYFLNFNSNSTNFGLIANNMIGGGFQTTGTAYGMYFSGSRYAKIYHNSISVDNPGTAARSLYVTTSGGNMELLNNVISGVCTGGLGAYSVYATTANAFSVMDHNLYHSNGTSLVFLGVNYNNLAALVAGQPSLNANSRSGPPSFVAPQDLHTFGGVHANWGTLTSVVNDFDLQTRPLAPDLVPDVGADEFVLAPIDPDLIAVASPLVGSPGPNIVSVTVQNNGGGSLNSTPITMEYSSDGGITWSGSQTFTPTALATTGTQQTFTFGTPLVLQAGTYNICVRISPQVVGDPDAVNQTCRQICAGLAGNFTINNTLPTGGSNYNSFADAVAALTSCGLGGPVVMQVAPGNYIEQVNLPAFSGSSAVNTLTFDGGNAFTTTISLSSSAINTAIVKLDGTDHVTFRNLTVEVTGTYGFCFHLTNQANFNTIENCRLLMAVNTSSVYQIGVLAAGSTYTSPGNNANNLIVRNNYIRGGYYGLRLNGISTTAYTSNNQVVGNTIEEHYYYGIYSQYQKAPRFDRNLIKQRTAGAPVTTVGYGIFSSYADSSFSFSYNVIPTMGSYGIYASQANNTNSGRGRIIGNMVGGDFQTNANAYCLYLTSAKDIDILSNSFHLGSFSGYAAYILGSVPTTDSLRIRGNIFSSANRFGGLGSPLRVVTPAAVQEMSHNIFFGFSPTLIQFGGTLFPNLTSFQATYPNFAGNSYEGFPGFRTDRDLHIICSPYDNLGVPSALVGNDVDNQARSSTTPDIGADEFTALAVSIDLGADTSHCGRLTITADTTNFDVFFWDGLPSGPSIVVDSSSQHYVVALDSNNCLASDTILVDILSFPTLVYEGDTVYQCAYDSLDVLNPGSSILWSTGDTTSVILPNGQGLYTASITNPSGCSATDSVTVLFFAGAVANLGSDSSFCSGGGYLLDAGQGPLGTTYTWNSGANTQVILVSAPGTYAVTVTTLDGCVASDSVFLNVLIPPAVSLGPDRFACDQVQLDAGNSGASFQWSLPGSQTANTQTISSPNSGLYSVTVTSSNGCSTSDEVQITVSSTPLVNLGSDQLLCNGSSATFNAGNPGFLYQWSSGQSSQSITVSSPGTYLVYVTNPTSQCQGSDTVEVTLSPLSVSLGPDFILCTGSQATLDGGPGAVGYAWNTGSSGQTILVNQAGSYSVTVVDGFGCTATDVILVSPGIRPAVGFSSPATVPLLQPANFTDNSAGVNGWLWDFGDGQISTQQNPVHVYQAMGTFNVCLTATNGDCDSTVCTSITVGPPVEIQDQFLSGHSHLFPNPGNGLYQLKFDLPSVLRLELCVMDEFGRRVMDWHTIQAFQQTESIDIRNLSNGLYYLNLKSEKGHNWIIKLVKQ